MLGGAITQAAQSYLQKENTINSACMLRTGRDSERRADANHTVCVRISVWVREDVDLIRKRTPGRRSTEIKADQNQS
jgi:hypothetical protein